MVMLMFGRAVKNRCRRKKSKEFFSQVLDEERERSAKGFSLFPVIYFSVGVQPKG